MPRPKTDEPTAPITLHVTTELRDRINAAAKAAGIPRSAWLKAAVELALGRSRSVVHRPVTQAAIDGVCPHPIGRRIGRTCGACGRTP